MERESKDSDLLSELTLKIIHDVIRKGINNVYLVGSLASGESTVLGGQGYVSDVDIIIDVGCFTFLRLYVVDSRKALSERLELMLRSQGLKSHVSPLVTSLQVARYFRSIRPNTLYMYEMRPVSCDEQRCTVTIDALHGPPSDADSLNLAFSSIADYVFLWFGLLGDMSEDEKSYVIAKRCLTLLNSLLIFKGLYARSYSGRMRMANQNYASLSAILEPGDMKVLQILTEFKLSGDPLVLNELQVNQRRGPVAFLFEYFGNLALRIFVYELASYTGSSPTLQSESGLTLHALLDEYKSRARVSLAASFLYALSQVGLFVKDRNKDRLKMTLYSVFSKRLKAGDLVRLFIGRTFAEMICRRENLPKERVNKIKCLWDQFMI